MGFQNPDDNDVYKNITDSKESQTNQKWTLYLIFCVMTVTAASFQFGFNISSLNTPTQTLKQFIREDFFFLVKQNKLKQEMDPKIIRFINDTQNNQDLKTNRNKWYNEEKSLKKGISDEEFLKDLEILITKGKISLNYEFIKTMFNETNSENLPNQDFNLTNIIQFEKSEAQVANIVDGMWTLVNSLFVVGGMLGAFGSKVILDIMGRKGGILFHYLFSITGSILVLISYYTNSPVYLIISRFLFGVQGGMSCSLIPTYLSEISPAALRGQTGVAHQLCLTFGILIAQILGFKQILGNENYWHFLLAFPIVPSIIGSFCLILFFPETPKALISKRKTEAAERALIRLRNRPNVNSELQEIFNETSGDNQRQQSVSFIELLVSKRYRWPLITALILQVSQQLCGINAVFFYSEKIFKNSGIADHLVQYAIFSTGVVNFFSTILCTFLIDRLGRRPLLIFPMMVIIVDFILLTVFLEKKQDVLSIVCIMVFIVCFAVGLGPIPFIYAAECFGQEARGAALAICMLTNWVSNLLLTLAFPKVADVLASYVFLVFCGIVILAVITILKKVPETKGKSLNEILVKLNGKSYLSENGNGNNLLMSEVKA